MRQFLINLLAGAVVVGACAATVYFWGMPSKQPQSAEPASETTAPVAGNESQDTLKDQLARIPALPNTQVSEGPVTVVPVPRQAQQEALPDTPARVEEPASPLLTPLSDPDRYWDEIDRHFQEHVRGRRAKRSPMVQPEDRSSQVRPRPISHRQLERKVIEMAQRYGVSPSLALALVRVESGFNPNAVSHKNAQGLMQILPETARRIGCSPSLLKDAHHNLECGMGHLRNLLEQYGDQRAALAAYYAGHVLDARLAPQTRDDITRYVGVVLAHAHNYDRRVRHGS